MKKGMLVFGLAIAGISFCVSVRAATGAYAPVAGFDSTDGTVKPLSASDISHVSVSDDTRMASNAAWPASGSFDETKYLEFDFQPNVPADTEISSVTVTHEYRLSSATKLVGAKLEIWDGGAWQDVPITMNMTTTDLSETKDISAFISSVDQVKNLKIRFLAYRNPPLATTAKTSHDYISLTVQYSGGSTPTPTPVSTPTPTPSLTPTPVPTIMPTAIPSPSETPASEPSALPTPAPAATTPTPIPIPQQAPVMSLTPSPTISAPPPSASPEIISIANALQAVIALPTAKPVLSRAKSMLPKQTAAQSTPSKPARIPSVYGAPDIFVILKNRLTQLLAVLQLK